MTGMRIRSFERADEAKDLHGGRFEVLKIGGTTLGRATYEPGWKWSVQVGAASGQSSCPVAHLGIVLAGRAVVAMDDGEQAEMGPGDVFEIGPGHDFWVIGDEPYVSIHLSGADEYAS